MGGYVPNTAAEREEMLREIGKSRVEELFFSLPDAVRFQDPLKIPKGKSEIEVRRVLGELAGKNTVFQTVFRGAGAYHHFVPAVVRHLSSREEFVTSYTPYQAEISQGVLQSIFEYQSAICALTGMDVSNASAYDGASAAAEAAMMTKERGRDEVFVSAAARPDVIETIKTYAEPRDVRVTLVPQKDGKTDFTALSSMLSGSAAAVYLENPNYFGVIEDAKEIGALAKERGAKFIMGVNPISLGILKSPGELGADIAVGEGQSLGLSLSFGGPYLGFMACKEPLVRRLPGRIVGETTDKEGRRAFVLTLQAREQHIRREKASSSLCSNEALCALKSAVYLSAMGPKGLSEVAGASAAKAHYLAEELSKIGLAQVYDSEFFHEFPTTAPKDSDGLLKSLEQEGILGPLPITIGGQGALLWCATELNTKEEIDRAVAIARKAVGA